MHLTGEVERGAWLQQRMGCWATVAGAAGTGFERYARLLHPVDADRLDLSVTDRWGQHPVTEHAQWPWRELAARNGRTMHPLVQWRRITDQERALEFADGWRAGQSREGWFDPALMAALTSHLHGHTARADDITIGIWNGWGISTGITAYVALDTNGDPAPIDAAALAALQAESRERCTAAYSPEYLEAHRRGPLLSLPDREYVLFAATLAALADPQWGRSAGIGWDSLDAHPSPQLVWPADRAWIVATEIDWDSTIVAGPAALIAEVLADERFEAFEVEAGDDLSWDGDTINRRR